jgi:elongator complex protein 2
MVGNKHAFFLALFADKCSSILAYTYNGAFYYWKRDGREYKSLPIVHGHFGPVMDLDWDKSNSHAYLVTTSEDQTTRIFTYWKANDSWHEVNRPQIHGYDINTLALLKNGDQNSDFSCKIVSGADEKIIRIFDPPYNLVKFLQNLSNVEIRYNPEHENSYYEKCIIIFIGFYLF